MTKEDNFSVTSLKITLIENKYGIKTMSDTPRNSQATTIIQRIHQVLGNLVHTYSLQETYVDDAYPWMGTIMSAVLTVLYIYRRTKGKSPYQLVFSQYMILPIKHAADWRYIRHHKQSQIEKDVILKKFTVIDYDYRVGYQVMIINK